tara:strand:+ start:613 stop:798 length:186 start_codon:yes stop_codon:yes gene_type:complete
MVIDIRPVLKEKIEHDLREKVKSGVYIMDGEGINKVCRNQFSLYRRLITDHGQDFNTAEGL